LEIIFDSIIFNYRGEEREVATNIVCGGEEKRKREEFGQVLLE
jgi:hypothetical protein